MIFGALNYLDDLGDLGGLSETCDGKIKKTF